MLHELTAGSALATLMGQFAPALLAQAAPEVPTASGPVQPLKFYPPGLSAWDPEVGDQEPVKALQSWTGNYIGTFLVTAANPKDAESVLQKGMRIDPALIQDGSYPVLLGFGTFENARSSRYPFIGLNYTEFLAAIPGVFLSDPKYRHSGPYVYPYRLYLNRLTPTIFGWLSGYPKRWERVSLLRMNGSGYKYLFTVRNLLSGTSLLELTFTVAGHFHRVKHFHGFDEISRLLIPNIVASGFFGIPVRTFFQLDVANAVAWNIPSATLRVNDPALFPVLPGTRTWKGIKQELYGAVRLYLPWRLTSADDPGIVYPWTGSPVVASEHDQDIPAAG